MSFDPSNSVESDETALAAFDRVLGLLRSHEAAAAKAAEASAAAASQTRAQFERLSGLTDATARGAAQVNRHHEALTVHLDGLARHVDATRAALEKASETTNAAASRTEDVRVLADALANAARDLLESARVHQRVFAPDGEPLAQRVAGAFEVAEQHAAAIHAHAKAYEASLGNAVAEMTTAIRTAASGAADDLHMATAQARKEIHVEIENLARTLAAQTPNKTSRAFGLAFPLLILAVGVVMGTMLSDRLLGRDRVPAPPSAVETEDQLRIRVYNGSGVDGLGATAAGRLRAVGMTVVYVGNAPHGIEPASFIVWHASSPSSGRVLENALGAPQLRSQLGAESPDFDADIMLGTDAVAWPSLVAD